MTAELTTAAQKLRAGDQKMWSAITDPEMRSHLADLLDAIEAAWPSHVTARTMTEPTARILRAARAVTEAITRSTP